MAIDFPASPALNDEFVAGGITYVFNGTGWTIKGGSAVDDWVNTTGDTMTGDLIINKDRPLLDLSSTAADPANVVHGTVNGAHRWALALGNGSPESTGACWTNSCWDRAPLAAGCSTGSL